MEWKPIETAPKDGTEILMWEYVYSVRLVWWNKTAKVWQDDTQRNYDPTHWMPLPDPPKDTKS